MPVRSSMCRRPAVTFPSSDRGFATGRWFTWTMQPRPRSRRWSLMRSVGTTSETTPTSIVACISFPNMRRKSSKGRGGRCNRSSTPPMRARSSLFAAPRKPSTSWRRPTAAPTFMPATKCSSPPWSITPTSCPGRSCAKRRAQGCGLRRSATAASCCSRTLTTCWDREPKSSP